MEIIGKILEVLPVEQGENNNRNWEKQNIIIETFEDYPKKICLSNWGKVNVDLIAAGTKVRAMVNIESRSYQYKWYTDIKVWKLDIIIDL